MKKIPILILTIVFWFMFGADLLAETVGEVQVRWDLNRSYSELTGRDQRAWLNDWRTYGITIDRIDDSTGESLEVAQKSARLTSEDIKRGEYNFKFQGVSGKSYVWNVTTTGDHERTFELARGWLILGEDQSKVVVKVSSDSARDGEIFGHVRDTRDKPVPGVAVRAEWEISVGLRRVLGEQFSTATTSIVPTEITTGGFRVSHLFPGTYTAYYDAPGFLFQTQVLEVGAGRSATPPTVVMSRPKGEIHGWVVDAKGRGIPGTCIRIDATLMPTQPDGEFRFTLVYPGAYKVFYDAPGYQGQVQENILVNQGVASPPRVIMSRR